MKVQQIYNELLVTVDKPINVMLVRRKINEALNYLSALFKSTHLKEQLEIKCTGIENYLLPDNLISVKNVLTSSGSNYRSYLVVGKNIKFSNEGTYLVNFTCKPQLDEKKMREGKALIEEEIPLNELYFTSLVLYVRSVLEDDIRKAADLATQATTLSREIDSELNRADRRGQKIPARTWR